MIVAEGATSDAVKEIMPSNISQLLEHAKFSWNTYGDANTTEGGAWVGITAGKSSIGYGIVDSSLSISDAEGEEEDHGEIGYIPNYSQRLLAAGKAGVNTSRMVVVSPWQTLLDVSFKFADKKIYANDDEAVKDSAIKTINESSNLTHMVIDLNSANIAGRQHGFSSSNIQYKDAINKVDGYIGEIVSALKARPTYDIEDWLIIITTTHGVKPDNITYGGATIAERKIFTIYHNENINKQEIVSPELTNALSLNGKADSISMPASMATAYDIPAEGGYTIMFKIRSITKSGSNTALLSKATHGYQNPYGWAFIMVGSNKTYRFGIGDRSSTNGNTFKYYIGGTDTEVSADLNVWDAIAFRVYDSASTRYAEMYTNGKRSPAQNIGNMASAAPASNLVIGTIATSLGSGAHAIISNLSIWNTALTTDEIVNANCSMSISATHPKYGNLIGYWPLDEGEGSVLKNYAPGATGKDFSFTDFGKRVWNLVDQACAISENTFQTSSTDIVPTIFYWLNASVADSWALEGKAWLKDYETEFVK
ncbi:LamG-like jellyroll fold domain-containing protein [Niabella ginsengisoli]|uniref:DUF4983 domain-containing protein n=1 Tax=Niabella ginsengisoli TaxID=522298 RepID=A0ABS9SJ02_9BACT|nr:LamG-like jellyroll fold domain-containing protein [Niabella ginsengisoli]MCH5598300.1 DUF4983 domain-containing protein [Niabella ginsengisoli]